MKIFANRLITDINSISQTTNNPASDNLINDNQINNNLNINEINSNNSNLNNQNLLINNPQTVGNSNNINVNPIIDDELEGYIYVFYYDDTYTHEGRSIQYKCHKNVVPIDVISVKFKDFKNYYSINSDKKNKTL